MKRVLICAAVAAASWLAPLGARTPLAQGVPAAAATQDTTARVIVKFRAESPLLRKQALSAAGQQTLQAASLGQRIGVALESGRGLTERSHVVIGHGLTSKQLAARIAAQSDVEFAFADERKHIVSVPNDPFYATGPAVAVTNGGPLVGQWYLRPPGTAGDANNTAPAAINAEQAWDLTKGNSGVVVAVLDTGVRFDHPDLQGGNVLPGYDMVSAEQAGTFTAANDGNGRDGDASDPGDFVNAGDAATLGCSQGNSSWHGTQTLGLIGAATNNGVGMASVSYGGVKVMPVRVLGKCGGFDSDIQAGMRWAAGLPVPGVPDNPTPARVINMSLGGVATCGSYASIVAEVNSAGAVVVVAAGNGASSSVSSPANCPGAIGVAGLRHAGDLVGYSDAGPEISIAAPAGNCVSTARGSTCLYPILTTTNKGTTTPVPGPPGASYTDSFDASLGTSFSAPLVAGTAALMLSVNPSLTPAQVKAKLMSSARHFVTSGGVSDAPTCPARSPTSAGCYCTTTTCGAGMLDAHAAVMSVNGVQASISLTTTTPTANQDVALTANPVLNPGQSVASYAWTILNAGTSGATITGANDGSSVVVRPTAAGIFLIQLTTTDNTGFVSVTTLPVTVIGPPPTVPATTPVAAPSGGGGGGGALGVGWLLLLLGAVVSLALTAGRARGTAAEVSAGARDARRR